MFYLLKDGQEVRKIETDSKTKIESAALELMKRQGIKGTYEKKSRDLCWVRDIDGTSYFDWQVVRV